MIQKLGSGSYKVRGAVICPFGWRSAGAADLARSWLLGPWGFARARYAAAGHLL